MVHAVQSTIIPLLLFSKLKRKGQDPKQTKDSLSRKKTNKTSQFFVTLQELLNVSATQALIP